MAMGLTNKAFLAHLRAQDELLRWVTEALLMSDTFWLKKAPYQELYESMCCKFYTHKKDLTFVSYFTCN